MRAGRRRIILEIVVGAAVTSVAMYLMVRLTGWGNTNDIFPFQMGWWGSLLSWRWNHPEHEPNG